MSDRRMEDRLPPHDKIAEVSLLGAIFRDPMAMEEVVTVLDAEDFYFDAHQKIYAAISAVAQTSQVDLVTVAEELRNRGQVNDVGGYEYLAEVFDTVPTAANSFHHAKIVRNAAIRRRLIHVAYEVVRDSSSGSCPADELLASFEQKLFDIGIRERGKDGPIDAKNLIADCLSEIDSRQSERSQPGVSMGLIDLDNLVGGLRPGSLTVIAARPGVGKTSLGIGVALNAITQGIPSLFVSLEMARNELGDRIISMRSSVDLHRIRGIDRLTQSEANAICSVSIAGQRMWIDDRPAQTVAQIASTVRRAVRKHKCGLVIVDYLQLVHPENHRDQRHLQVGMVATRLKELARTAKVPVIAMAQLNRQSENRAGGRPALSDLRESGNIEQDADTVILLHPQELVEGSPVQNVDAIVEKNRNGPRGIAPLVYRRPNVRFENCTADVT